MSSKRWALFFYIIIAGFGLWLGQSQADLIATGLSESVFNLLNNAAGVASTVIGGIIIYILGGTKDELPTVERTETTKTVGPAEPINVTGIGGPSSFESSIGKQH